MPFHVEVRRSLHRAWAFNLDRERVDRGVIDPWLAGRMLRLGDRDWLPRDCALRIVEGPQLPPQDLAFGQGWSAAERSGEDVTRRLLGEAAGARASANGADEAAIRDALAAALAAAGDGASLDTLAAHLHRELTARLGRG